MQADEWANVCLVPSGPCTGLGEPRELKSALNSAEIGAPLMSRLLMYKAVVCFRLEGHLTRGNCSLSSLLPHFYTFSHPALCRAP